MFFFQITFVGLTFALEQVGIFEVGCKLRFLWVPNKSLSWKEKN